jgi:hypothetical protein
MDDNEKTPNGLIGAASPAALDRMVDRQEFKMLMERKASSIEMKNCAKYIDILHNQIK